MAIIQKRDDMPSRQDAIMAGLPDHLLDEFETQTAGSTDAARWWSCLEQWAWSAWFDGAIKGDLQ